jgi:hypothetical protein
MSILWKDLFYITDRGCNLHSVSTAIDLMMKLQAFPSVDYVIKHRDTIICLAELHDMPFTDNKKSQLSCDVDEYVKKLNKLIDDTQNKNNLQ